jgi:hypothetical protein
MDSATAVYGPRMARSYGTVVGVDPARVLLSATT